MFHLFICSFINKSLMKHFLFISHLFFFIICISALAAGVRGGMFKFTIGRLNYRINLLLFQSILKQEIGFFDTTRTGMQSNIKAL